MQLLTCEGMLGLLGNEGADKFTASLSKPNIMPNNAGILTWPADTTKEGYDNIFGVNDVRHTLLTKLLLLFLQRATEKPISDVI